MSNQNYSSSKLGQLLLDAGKLSTADAEKVMRLQKAENLRFGDAAIQLGLVSELDIQYALAQQFDYPYLKSNEEGYSPELVAAYKPFLPQVEQLRSLRSQLMLRWFAQGHKLLSLVGTQAGDGNSNLVANLAIVFSQLGERTLLIDADLRAPRQHTLFNLGNRPGLSDILIGRADHKAAVRLPAFVDLTILTAGATPPNPSELLSNAALLNLYTAYSSMFDVILIDTTPSDFCDTCMLGARSTGVLITARQDYSRMSKIDNMVTNFKECNLTVVGAVMNQF